jgi:hypothetical protein
MLSKASERASDKPDNSVLVVLQELRRMEDDRVKAEADARKARLEAEERAREDAAEAARREQQRRVLEEAARLRHEAEAAEARQREEALRREAAERRVRIEAEVALRAERLRLEAEQRRPHGGSAGTERPRSAVRRALPLVVAAALLLGMGGVAARVSRQQQVALEDMQRELARQRDRVPALQADHDRQLRIMKEEMDRNLGRAGGAAGPAGTAAGDSGRRPAEPRKGTATATARERRPPPRRPDVVSAPHERPAVDPVRRPGVKRDVGNDPLGGMEPDPVVK